MVLPPAPKNATTSNNDNVSPLPLAPQAADGVLAARRRAVPPSAPRPPTIKAAVVTFLSKFCLS